MLKIIYRYEARRRSVETLGEQKRVSDRLLDLIDILFALVIVEGALFYRPILAAHGHRNLPVVLALALIVYTVVRSFVDWHVLMEHTPYQIIASTSERVVKRGPALSLQVRTLELWRLYMDFLIVVTYSVMLLRAHVLLDDPAAGVRFLLWSFPALFFLYLLWGELFRRAAGGQQQFSEWLLVAALCSSIALASAYNAVYDTHAVAGHGSVRNAVALLVESALMAGYRFFNWKQQRTIE